MERLIRALDLLTAALVVLILAGMRAALVGILLGLIWPPAGIVGGLATFAAGIRPLEEWDEG